MSCPCQNTSYREQPGATKSGLQWSPSRKQSSLLGQLLPGIPREKKKWYKWLNTWNRELRECFSKSRMEIHCAVFPAQCRTRKGWNESWICQFSPTSRLGLMKKKMPAVSIGSAFIYIPEVFTNWLVRKSDSSVILVLVCMQMNLPKGRHWIQMCFSDKVNKQSQSNLQGLSKPV